MRIVHTCLRYPPATGGVETYVQGIVSRTRDHSALYDVRVLSSRLRTHWPMAELDPSQLLSDPPYLQRLHHSSTPFLAYPRLQALAYYLRHHQPDLLHGYSFWYQPADVAARYARRHNIPFIFHPMYYDNAVRRKWRWLVYKKTIGRRTLAAAAAVVVISPFEQQLIERANLPVRRFVQIPPGIDLADFSALQPNPFLPRGIKPPVILCVSRLAPSKGLADVITALPAIISAVPNVNLALVGEDFGALFSLQRLIKHLGLSRRVYLLGRLSSAELIGAYQHADLFIHPSYYEAFGIVVIQAMAARLPVIARHTSALPFLVPPGQAGLLFQTSDEMIKQVITLLSRPKSQSPYVAAAYQRVKQLFTWDSSIKKLINLYQELRPS